MRWLELGRRDEGWHGIEEISSFKQSQHTMHAVVYRSYASFEQSRSSRDHSKARTDGPRRCAFTILSAGEAQARSSNEEYTACSNDRQQIAL